VAVPASGAAEEAGGAEAGGEPRRARRLPRASGRVRVRVRVRVRIRVRVRVPRACGRERCHSAGPRPSNRSSA